MIIDAREAFRAKRAGKGQWTAGFLRELQSRSVDLTILADSDCTLSSAVRFPKNARWHLHATQYALQSSADIYISPTSFIVPFLLRNHMKCVPVVHDLIAFQNEPHNTKAKLIERLLLKNIISNSQCICTVSAATKADLLVQFQRLSPSYVVPIFAGPMHENPPLSSADKKTILCIGTLCPRKNQERLIRAYALLSSELRSQYSLEIVGARGWDDAEILRLARVTEGVTWRDYVSDSEYAALLSHATLFAYPSLYEGFGMQVLDALQRGIPVLTSDRGSLKEVAGDAAFIVNPEDEHSIVKGLATILENDDIQAKLSIEGPKRASEYSWKRTVDLFLSAVESNLY